MKNKLIAAVSILLILSAGTAMAETLTLEECIDTALKNHPDMVAAEAQIASRKAAAGESAAGARPQIKAGASYTRSDSTNKTDDDGSYNTSVSLEQSVYDWGKRASG